MAMDSLTDWYRYIDQVSRPARKNSDEDEEPEPWRPWNQIEEATPIDTALPADAIPDLAEALGLSGPTEAMHPGAPEYIDPTVHDQLAPIPSFSAPSLSAPSFEITIPRLGQRPLTREIELPQQALDYPDSGRLSAFEREAPGEFVELPHAVSEETVHLAESAASESFRTPDADPEALHVVEGEEAGAKSQGVRHWDLLYQIRSHDVAQNSYKSTFRETREELVQRLLDPPLTLEETARLLGVCPTTVRRYTNKGQLRHFRTTGNQRRFRLSDVLEFLESRATEIEADARADRAAGLEN